MCVITLISEVVPTTKVFWENLVVSVHFTLKWQLTFLAENNLKSLSQLHWPLSSAHFFVTFSSLFIHIKTGKRAYNMIEINLSSNAIALKWAINSVCLNIFS